MAYQRGTTKKMVQSFGSQNLQRKTPPSLDTVVQNWFPANPTILSMVQEKLRGGDYQNNRLLLVADIKQDPALFVYCARSLKNLIENKRESFDPLQLLQTITDEQLKQLLLIAPSSISSHNFADINQLQAMRHQHSLVGAHAAESIAKQVHIAGDVAFTSSLFRQLGLNLIAWNYPRIYSKALKAEQERPGHLEFELQKYLQTSPARLGARLAAEWGISPKIRKVIAPAQGEGETESLEAGPINLQALCELSELYAQVKDPVHFPQAEKQWKTIAPFVETVIDVAELDDAAEKVHQILEQSGSEIPAIKSLPLVEHHGGENIAAVRRSEELFKKNNYVQKCPDGIRESFHEVYNLLAQTQVSLEALRLLVDKVVPQLGFEHGCLFLTADRSLELKPALKIGPGSISDYELFLENGDNGIAIALESMVPVRKDGKGIHGTLVTQICCSLQNSQHPGVLYLELSTDSAAGSNHQTVPYFHAVRTVINDCITEGS